MADSAVSSNEDAPRPRRRRFARWQVIAPLAIFLVVAAVGWWWVSRGQQATDDAQIDGDVVPIAAKVGGILKDLSVVSNQAVDAGAVLAVIDPRDFEAAVARAEADLEESRAILLAAEAGVPITSAGAESQLTSATAGQANAVAAIAVAERDVEAAQAKLAASRARRREAEAHLIKASQDVERLRPLADKDQVPRQQMDAAVATLDGARAAVDSTQAAITEAETGVAAQDARLRQARGALTQATSAVSAARTAPRQIDAARARVASARAQVSRAEAMLQRVRLDIEYATVRAPSAGVVSRITAKPGQVIQPGQPLMALVPIHDVWVTANFKETQLQAMRVGQTADVMVDAYGGREYRGRVLSLAPATGARFGLLPPENASGNYVKVVQRVPVRIALDAGQDPEQLLRPGMSVFVTVHTR